MATLQELMDLIQSGKTSFVNPQELPAGKAFHYTQHKEAIENKGFLGRKLGNDIGYTQDKLVSDPATEPDGLVYAYEDINDALDEGGAGATNTDIFEISYSKAIRAIHAKEAQEYEAPPTVLIMAPDITGFKFIGKGHDIRPPSQDDIRAGELARKFLFGETATPASAPKKWGPTPGKKTPKERAEDRKRKAKKDKRKGK